MDAMAENPKTLDEAKRCCALVRLRPDIKEAALRAAKNDRRSLNNLIETIVARHLQAAGYLSPQS